MKVTLAYGRTGLECEVPDVNLVGVLGLQARAALPDPSAAIRLALGNPIGTRSLKDLAVGKSRPCIVVCDITRPVPNPILLPPVLDELQAAGIQPHQVTILIATGTHRPNRPEELRAMLGERAAAECRVVNHVCTDTSSLVNLGVSPNGVPVFLNREYVDADLRMTVGLIEPHFMAGFSGGRKLIMPGIAGLETVQAWHSPRFLEHPNASAGVVAGNPVHEESLAIASLVRPDLICDVVLDEQNQITAIFAGDLETAWLDGVQEARRAASASVDEPVDIVVTTCAGAPLDATFYQAVKGMVGALPILKPGGTVIIAAECVEGIGSDHFKRQLFETDDLAQYIQAMVAADWTFVPDQWEVEELAKVVLNHPSIAVCRGIPDEDLARCFVTPARSVEEAVTIAVSRHGPEARIAVIPKGPYVLPTVCRAR